MHSKLIQKYKDKSVAKLIITAQKYFNEYIRLRDCDEYGLGICISSGHTLRVPSTNAQAGHFYSAGHYPILRFNEDNVHLQGKSDNYFKSGNLIEYRKNLEKKIGTFRLEKLDEIADYSKRHNFKWDRIELIVVRLSL